MPDYRGLNRFKMNLAGFFTGYAIFKGSKTKVICSNSRAFVEGWLITMYADPQCSSVELYNQFTKEGEKPKTENVVFIRNKG